MALIFVVTVAATARAELGVVVAAPGLRVAVGAGAGGVLLQAPKAVYLLGGDGALARRDDLAKAAPEETTRLAGNQAALVAYGTDGASALVTLGRDGAHARPLPAAMRGAIEILLDNKGTPALALVERNGWKAVVGARGPLALPGAPSVPGVIPVVAAGCRTMSPRAIGLDGDGALLVAATTCRRDAPTALLRWPRAGGAMVRTALPASLDLGAPIVDGDELVVATKADDLGTFSPVGALRVPRGGGPPMALPPTGERAIEPPQLARGRDGTLWMVALVKLTAERMGPVVLRFTGGRWGRVTLPTVDGAGALVAERLVADGSGRVFVLARAEKFEIEGRWLLGDTDGRPGQLVPPR